MYVSPLVSIVVPCFNYGHYILETLTSVLEQSFPHWECIIVDDGSTDNTRDVVVKFVEKDERFRYIYQPNKGMSGARNTAFKMAKGSYIQLLDADDLLEFDKLNVQVNFLHNNPDVDIVYSDVRFFTDKDKNTLLLNYPGMDGIIPMPRISGRGATIVKAFLRGTIKINTALFRKSILNKIGYMDEKLTIAAEDWNFWLTAAIYKLKFFYLDIPDTCALVRAHSESVSMPDSKKLLKTRPSTEAMLESIYETYSSLELLKKLDSKVVSEIFGNKALNEISAGDIKKGLYYLYLNILWGYRKLYYLHHGIYHLKERLIKNIII
ncbi:glycosyltransferase [Rhodocytophaga aerolata]|uniref:Glycosyltransferase n=1 Tax=Rhodocytophaga aerolata TaxID=455078 RepID=A0ABT8RC93_9BACT|nr:glycosyltransferase [Rhodocytophaga aerolata]MDO1448838.1 glycosyltransferase [Rhodocytophaga aerolata]